MNVCNECKPRSPETESSRAFEREVGREQVVEQINALTSNEDKPCGSPERKLHLPMRDPWGIEILQGHPLYCMVPMHTAESAKPSTDSCTPGGRSSRPPSDRSSGTQEKARSGKKRASLKRRGSTDLSEMEKEKHERRKESNRNSARKSRKNTKDRINRLEEKVKGLMEENAVLEGENEMALVENHRIAMERDRSERQVLEVTDEAQRRSQAMREDLISLIRHHRKFCADLGVPDPSFPLLNTDIHSCRDPMQQNEGNLNAFDNAATPGELLGPREESFQDMSLQDMDILLPSQSTLDLLLLNTERWGVELGWR